MGTYSPEASPDSSSRYTSAISSGAEISALRLALIPVEFWLSNSWLSLAGWSDPGPTYLGRRSYSLGCASPFRTNCSGTCLKEYHRIETRRSLAWYQVLGPDSVFDIFADVILVHIWRILLELSIKLEPLNFLRICTRIVEDAESASFAADSLARQYHASGRVRAALAQELGTSGRLGCPPADLRAWAMAADCSTATVAVARPRTGSPAGPGWSSGAGRESSDLGQDEFVDGVGKALVLVRGWLPVALPASTSELALPMAMLRPEWANISTSLD